MLGGAHPKPPDPPIPERGDGGASAGQHCPRQGLILQPPPQRPPPAPRLETRPLLPPGQDRPPKAEEQCPSRVQGDLPAPICPWPGGARLLRGLCSSSRFPWRSCSHLAPVPSQDSAVHVPPPHPRDHPSAPFPSPQRVPARFSDWSHCWGFREGCARRRHRGDGCGCPGVPGQGGGHRPSSYPRVSLPSLLLVWFGLGFFFFSPPPSLSSCSLISC